MLTGSGRVAPLSEEERSLQEAKQAEADASRGTTSRSSHVGMGVKSPMKDEALQALRDLGNGGHNLVQLVCFRSSWRVV
jgi:twinfilin-like protein